MKSLLISEFQRLWKRKSTLAIMLAIPVILIASAKYYLGVNSNMEITNPQYTSFYNFPVAAIQEQLVFAFNIIVVLLMVLSVTQEFADGSIRMVLIRTKEASKVFVAKFLVVVSTILIFLFIYLVLGIFIGYFLFPKIDTVPIFYWSKTFSGFEVFIYTLKYYIFAFITLVSIASLIFFVSIISKSVVITVGISIGLILTLIIYPIFILIVPIAGDLIIKLQLLSITQIQYQGIAMMLGEGKYFWGWTFSIMVAYICIFIFGSYLAYRKRDNLI